MLGMRNMSVGCGFVWVAFFLVGCASAKPTYLDSGQAAYLVKCGGWFSSWNACVVKAGRVCRRRGYTVTTADEFEGRMLVACKGESPTARP